MQLLCQHGKDRIFVHITFFCYYLRADEKSRGNREFETRSTGETCFFHSFITDVKLHLIRISNNFRQVNVNDVNND